jgi:hypothetical protein
MVRSTPSLSKIATEHPNSPGLPCGNPHQQRIVCAGSVTRNVLDPELIPVARIDVATDGTASVEEL